MINSVESRGQVESKIKSKSVFTEQMLVDIVSVAETLESRARHLA